MLKMSSRSFPVADTSQGGNRKLVLELRCFPDLGRLVCTSGFEAIYVHQSAAGGTFEACKWFGKHIGTSRTSSKCGWVRARGLGAGRTTSINIGRSGGSRARRNVTNRNQGCLHRVLDYKGWAGKSNKSTTSYTSSVARRGKTWHV